METYRLQDLSIEITHNCPLKCIHCSTFNGASNPRLRLDSENIVNIAKQALPLGLESISLSGGEPCTHPDLINVVRNLKLLGLSVSLYTCGVVQDYLSRPVPLSKAFLESLKGSGLDRIIFNFQSSRPNVHEKITKVAGSYSCVINSIENSLDLDIQTELHTVPMRQNLQSLPDTIDYTKDMGLTRLSLLRFVPQGRGSTDSQSKLLNSSEYRDLEDMIKKANGFLRLGAPFNFLNHEKKVPCTAAIDKLVIRADGRVIPCEAFKQSNFSFGKIRSGNVVHIWSSSEFSKFRQCLIKGCPRPAEFFNNESCLGQALIQISLSYPDCREDDAFLKASCI